MKYTCSSITDTSQLPWLAVAEYWLLTHSNIHHFATAMSGRTRIHRNIVRFATLSHWSREVTVYYVSRYHWRSFSCFPHWGSSLWRILKWIASFATSNWWVVFYMGLLSIGLNIPALLLVWVCYEGLSAVFSGSPFLVQLSLRYPAVFSPLIFLWLRIKLVDFIVLVTIFVPLAHFAFAVCF